MTAGTRDLQPAHAQPGEPTLLERGFPFREVSLVIKADRRSKDSVYGAHRWWARRPPALLRSMLLAAAQSEDRGLEQFWKDYEDTARHLEGWRVHDPFIGGGSTLVEAARLGATVTGGDVDPLAVEIVRYELSPADPEAIRTAGDALLDHVRTTCGHLYPTSGTKQPLHYFWLHEVKCPACQQQGLLYKDLVIARDRRKPGAVVRDHPLTVFSPDDLSIINLNSAERLQFDKAGRRWRVGVGTFVRNRYTCPHCGERSMHKDLATGVAPRRLLAVEETVEGGRRNIRTPTVTELKATRDAAAWVAAHREELDLPRVDFVKERHDDRPRSYGIQHVVDLFTDRQLAVLGTAFAWLRTADLTPEVAAGIRLALSNSLATNNKLCSYAYDYGRLSALFSVRGYSLPALPVELNPLHDGAGRGTLRQCIERVARAGVGSSRRNIWSPSAKAPRPKDMILPTNSDTTRVVLESATTVSPTAAPLADVCIFDPPYFDYIAYSELSELYRSWRESTSDLDAPLLPSGDDRAESFGLSLGAALRVVLSRLAPGRPLAFTYHSTDPEAWRAIGIAIDEAKLRVTGLWPVYSDGHMGHHSHPGNCEWDLVVVCRRFTETVPARFDGDATRWAQAARPLKIGKADRASIGLAIAITASRFGDLATKEPLT